jgi:hypothetical protein
LPTPELLIVDTCFLLSAFFLSLPVELELLKPLLVLTLEDDHIAPISLIFSGFEGVSFVTVGCEPTGRVMVPLVQQFFSYPNTT